MWVVPEGMSIGKEWVWLGRWVQMPMRGIKRDPSTDISYSSVSADKKVQAIMFKASSTNSLGTRFGGFAGPKKILQRAHEHQMSMIKRSLASRN